MRQFILLVFAVVVFATDAFARTVNVRGYTKKNGTYVQPRHRTSPNKTKNDNWSTKGNVNPYTGKPGSKNP